jgi:hypothetical protein
VELEEDRAGFRRVAFQGLARRIVVQSKILAALAAAALLGTSSVAAAQSTDALSLANSPAVERAGGDLEDGNALRRGPGRWIIGAAALGLIIWGIIELVGDNEEDFPSSP